MSTEYTKGPWRYEYEPGYCGELIAPDGMTIAAFIDEPREHDARLIAAAPEMYEALVDAEAALRHMDKTIEWEFGDCRSDDEIEADKDWSPDVYKARAAIAKAKGERP